MDGGVGEPTQSPVLFPMRPYYYSCVSKLCPRPPTSGTLSAHEFCAPLVQGIPFHCQYPLGPRGIHQPETHVRRYMALAGRYSVLCVLCVEIYFPQSGALAKP
jgi:hypothetical protein